MTSCLLSYVNKLFKKEVFQDVLHESYLLKLITVTSETKKRRDRVESPKKRLKVTEHVAYTLSYEEQKNKDSLIGCLVGWLVVFGLKVL